MTDMFDLLTKNSLVLNNARYYMSLAYMVSMQSEDTSTRVGAVNVCSLY